MSYRPFLVDILNKWSENVYMHLSRNVFSKKISTHKKHQVEQFLRYLQNSFCRSSQNLVAKKLQSPFLIFGLNFFCGGSNAKKRGFGGAGNDNINGSTQIFSETKYQKKGLCNFVASTFCELLQKEFWSYLKNCTLWNFCRIGRPGSKNNCRSSLCSQMTRWRSKNLGNLLI